MENPLVMKSVTSSHTDVTGRQPDDSESRLLDEIRKGFGFESDAQLAAWLGVDRTAIYAVRDGRSRLSAIQRLKVLDRLGFLKSRKLVESLLPQKLAAEVTRWSQQAAVRSVAKSLRAGNANDDTVLLELCKRAFGFATDAELAAFLGLQRPAISMIRSGKSGLGPLPRLRILSKIAPDVPCSDVERALASNDYLLSLMAAPPASRPSGRKG
jgi:DNA-binding XRE family transcriptional regulator